ncbi:MAG: hypothetical protein O3B01_25845, partial [Planctomycetota bacterium]|nr:hypothetical protein [Planctomycetota bacterium]
MKEFLKNIFGFCFIAAFAVLVSGWVLPPTTFTFRMWEALYVKNKSLCNGRFYPNHVMEMMEEGDLAHHTKYAVKRKVIWRTDKLGFRNDKFIADPDIILIGDSNFAGSGMTQEDTLVNRLNSMLEGTPAYCIAPSGLTQMIELHQKGLLGTPKLVIQGIVEFYVKGFSPINLSQRYISQYHDITSTPVPLDPFSQFLAIQRDKLSKFNSFRYLRARARSSQGMGIQSKIDPRMFFVQREESVIVPEPELIEKCAASVASYKRYCRSIGSEFIFFPIPNKETVYF